MRAVILSAGPYSLGLYDQRAEDFDLVVAVNTAATLYAHDWWACADWDRFANIEPIDQGHFAPLFMMDAEADKASTKSREKFDCHPKCLRFKATAAGCHPGPPDATMSNTAPAALVLVRFLGATSVDVYGHDMAGDADCIGITTRHRNPERWQRERVQWAANVRWLQRSGIVVNRHIAEGSAR